MQTEAPVAKSIAMADKRLETLSILCGILAGRIDASRRDLRQIRSDVIDAQRHQETAHAAAREISADMLAG